MVDIVTEWRDYATTFNGAEVRMQLRPLTRGAFLLLMAHQETFAALAQMDANGLADQGAVAAVYAGVGRLLDDIAPHVGDHVRGIEGFTIDGETPSAAAVFEAAACMPLAIDIASRLADISALTPADLKNSNRPPASPPSGGRSASRSADGPPTGGWPCSTTATKDGASATPGASGPDPAA